MNRPNQSTTYPFCEPIRKEGFIPSILPEHHIVSVLLINTGTSDAKLWNNVPLPAGSSMPIACDITAFISLSKVPVWFSSTVEEENSLIVMVESVTQQQVDNG